MGAEANCTATVKGWTVSGKARIESDVLQFRAADLKLSIPFKEMKNVAARGGSLTMTCRDGAVSFDLGAAAPKWARKILHPPSRLDKLGVKLEWRASILGVNDEDFVKELEERIAFLSVGWPRREAVRRDFFRSDQGRPAREAAQTQGLAQAERRNLGGAAERPSGDQRSRRDGCREGRRPRGCESRQLLAHAHRGKVRDSGQGSDTLTIRFSGSRPFQ